MERFYTYLRQGLGKADALRHAQLDVRKQYPNPYYWAGFVLSGDGGQMKPLIPWMWIGIAIFLTVLMIGLAFAMYVLHRRVAVD